MLAGEQVEKVYGPVNIECAKLSEEDIPDALIASGELREKIQDKYTKRLYNEEKDLNTLMYENDNGERTMYLFKKPDNREQTYYDTDTAYIIMTLDN